VSDRPYVVCSVAMSLDGYIDDMSDQRLILSGAADLDRVDEERACSDAILVGAETVRRDNPRLLVRSPLRQQRRLAAGLPAHPVKVTVTGTGVLDPAAAFFTLGDSVHLVYGTSAAMPVLTERLADTDATVVDAGVWAEPGWLLTDLASRGVRRLLIEGGSGVHTAFLTAGLVDELQVVVAPLFVGDPTAPRFVTGGRFPPGRLQLVEVRPLEDVVLMRYLLSNTDG
jgi:5-amino-6-(5-phosphoribosylamino)uracil reductase